MADADKVHICRGPLVAAMPENWYPVQWAGRQAVVTLPENIDSSNAAPYDSSHVQEEASFCAASCA